MRDLKRLQQRVSYSLYIFFNIFFFLEDTLAAPEFVQLVNLGRVPDNQQAKISMISCHCAKVLPWHSQVGCSKKKPAVLMPQGYWNGSYFSSKARTCSVWSWLGLGGVMKYTFNH